MTTNKNIKREVIFSCLGVLLVVLTVIGLIVFLAYKFGPDPASFQQASMPPQPGFWKGEKTYVYFTITRTGGIEDFHLQPNTSQEVSAFCEFIMEFQPTLANGQIVARQERNLVEGYFAADGKFHGTYSISDCGEWNVPAQEGNWDAEWISESAPLP